MHFAIFAEERAIGIEHGAAVVIDAGARRSKRETTRATLLSLAALESASVVAAGNGFGEIEKRGVFRAAEILASKKFVHADDLRAAFGRLVYFVDSARQIFRCVLRAAHLKSAQR